MEPAELLPHRAPILCVDRVVETSAEHAVCEQVARDGWEGWLVEGLAQTTAILDGTERRAAGRGPLVGMLVGVRKFAIARTPEPGERVRLRVDVIRRLPPLALVRGEATSGGELLASGELKFYMEEPGPE